MIKPGFVIFILVLVLSDKCIIEKDLEDRIQSFLAPFSQGLTRQFIASAKTQKYVCLVEIKNGKIISDCILPAWKEYFQKAASELPNVLIVMNQIDSPRIVKGSCLEDQDWTKCACDKDYVKPDHGFFLTKNNWTPIFKKIPLFGPTTVSQCFLDIILPSIYHFQNIHRRKIAWDTAQPIGFWRGSTTGSSFDQNNPPYAKFHRQRLVSLCMKIPYCDAKFTAYVQCSEQICENMKKDYGEANSFVKYSSQPDYKVLIDIDGNTFSARFDRLLQSGSLVLKIAAFEDMISLLTKPWLHFVPVKMDLSDFQDKLEWALSNQNSIRQIGTWARERAIAVLNNHTYHCYIVRLLTEYSKLFKEETSLGESLMNSSQPSQKERSIAENGKKIDK